MNFRILPLLLCLLIPTFGIAQQRLSLEEALSYAKEKGYNKRKADLEVLKAKAKVSETIGTGLPQISVGGNYQNNLVIPKSPIPAILFNPEAGPDDYVAVAFSQKQSLGANITANQMIFNGSYIIGLRASKEYAKLYEIQQEKSWQDTQQEVYNAYYSALVAKQNAEILAQTVATTEQLFNETRALYENGLVEESEADQLQITVNELKNNIEYANSLADLSISMLKFKIGMPQIEQLVLTTNLETELTKNPSALLSNMFDAETNVDILLAKQNTILQELNMKATKASALPTLNGFFTHQVNAFSQSFTFLQNDQNYIPGTFFGISLNIPIWTSLSRHYKVKQNHLTWEQAKLTQEQAEDGAQLAFKQAQTTFKFQLNNYNNAKANFSLAEKINTKTQVKYKEGVASSFELAQAQSQFLQAESKYVDASLQLLNAKIELKKSLNNL